MTVLQLALAIGLGLLLAGAAGWCLQVTLRFEIPIWGTTPLLSFACWWLGQALLWTAMLLLAGGGFGLAVRAGWTLLEPTSR